MTPRTPRTAPGIDPDKRNEGRRRRRRGPKPVEVAQEAPEAESTADGANPAEVVNSDPVATETDTTLRRCPGQ